MARAFRGVDPEQGDPSGGAFHPAGAFPYSGSYAGVTWNAQSLFAVVRERRSGRNGYLYRSAVPRVLSDAEVESFRAAASSDV